MGNIAAFLLALCIPLVKKVLVGLGVGIVTYAGLTAIGNQITSAIQASWGDMGSSTLAILYLGGAPQSVGIVLGSISGRIAFISLGKIGRVTT